CPPHLLSFPTRRSSDLTFSSWTTLDGQRSWHRARSFTSRQWWVSLSVFSRWARSFARNRTTPHVTSTNMSAWMPSLALLRTILRSEEHTSELQSLAYLV